MENSEKIAIMDMILDKLQNTTAGEDIPVMVGKLKVAQGINGFKLAEIGHPVFEYKDRYVIYMESNSPMAIKKEGKLTEIKEFKVAVGYYKDSLKHIIDYGESTSAVN